MPLDGSTNTHLSNPLFHLEPFEFSKEQPTVNVKSPLSAKMGAPLWTQEEKDCFVNFIIPRSQFASGQYDAATGLTWKEHAPIMEVEMTRRGGYPELRVYTENALSQLYYNRFSARAVSRGQSDMTMMRASPRKSQPPSRSSTASVSRDCGQAP